ncbi:MAG: elongation factor Ts [Deltaproteobacteria bacterium]|nr:elongation factor Ts [Deltaproteobacteria bacterium]
MIINAQLVRELREKTGAGMMECKKALAESAGVIDSAIEYLRKQGLQALGKKAGRIAADGLVASRLSADKKAGSLVEVNCETDFVAKNDDFRRFAEDLAELALTQKQADVSALLAVPLKGETVADRLNRLTAKIGEKLSLRRAAIQTAVEGEKLGTYVHLGNKIGVLVKIRGNRAGENLAKDIAMHVAASHPQFLRKEDIPPEVAESEKAIYREQMKNSGKPLGGKPLGGKPPAVLEKIIEGKFAKFVGETCLNDQIFIKDPSGKKTVRQILKEVDPSLEVVAFVRYQVGEGIEKKKDDFAAEVAKMIK